MGGEQLPHGGGLVGVAQQRVQELAGLAVDLLGVASLQLQVLHGLPEESFAGASGDLAEQELFLEGRLQVLVDVAEVADVDALAVEVVAQFGRVEEVGLQRVDFLDGCRYRLENIVSQGFEFLFVVGVQLGSEGFRGVEFDQLFAEQRGFDVLLIADQVGEEEAFELLNEDVVEGGLAVTLAALFELTVVEGVESDQVLVVRRRHVQFYFGCGLYKLKIRLDFLRSDLLFESSRQHFKEADHSADLVQTDQRHLQFAAVAQALVEGLVVVVLVFKGFDGLLAAHLFPFCPLVGSVQVDQCYFDFNVVDFVVPDSVLDVLDLELLLLRRQGEVVEQLNHQLFCEIGEIWKHMLFLCEISESPRNLSWRKENLFLFLLYGVNLLCRVVLLDGREVYRWV